MSIPTKTRPAERVVDRVCHYIDQTTPAPHVSITIAAFILGRMAVFHGLPEEDAIRALRSSMDAYREIIKRRLN